MYGQHVVEMKLNGMNDLFIWSFPSSSSSFFLSSMLKFYFSLKLRLLIVNQALSSLHKIFNSIKILSILKEIYVKKS